jgi:hypothetical protein
MNKYQLWTIISRHFKLIYAAETRGSIPGLPVSRFPAIFIPEFPGMRTLRFPGIGNENFTRYVLNAHRYCRLFALLIKKLLQLAAVYASTHSFYDSCDSPDLLYMQLPKHSLRRLTQIAFSNTKVPFNRAKLGGSPYAEQTQQHYIKYSQKHSAIIEGSSRRGVL